MLGASTRRLGRSAGKRGLTVALGIPSRRLRRVGAHAASRGSGWGGAAAAAGEGRDWGHQPRVWDAAPANWHSP